MGEINVSNIKTGMKVAQDVNDSTGRFLIGKGVVIEEKHIRILKMWGVTSVDIEGANREQAAQDEIDQIDPALLPIIREYVDSRFYQPAIPLTDDSRDHEALSEIKHACVLRTAKRIANREIKLSHLQGFIKKSKESVPAGPLPKEKRGSAEELVEKSIQLATFPDVYNQIIKVLNDTKSSASHLARVVGSDPGLTATLLKLVNSVFYGLPSQVTSITRAIALIGGKELSMMAMGISVISHFEDIPPKMIDMKGFWKHSIATGVFARILAHRKVGLSEEELFLAGLMHDIGRLIVYQGLPKTAAYILHESHHTRVPLYHLEEEILGYDHTTVAGLILKKWNFPEPLEQMIKYHHHPFTSPIPIETSVICIANIMATAWELGYSGSVYVPFFEKEIWEKLELSTSVLRPSLKQGERQVNEVMRTFSLD